MSSWLAESTRLSSARRGKARDCRVSPQRWLYWRQPSEPPFQDRCPMSPLPDHAEHVQERAEAADDATLAAELRLCMVSGVGPLMRRKLLERFGSAAGVFKAAPSELRDVDGVGPKLVREITAA